MVTHANLLELPPGYRLDWDPDLLLLRRADESVVATFSADGALPENIRRTAEEDVYSQASPARAGERVVPGQSLLQARFFGRFELLRDDRVVPLGRNAKVLAILKYILVHRDRPVSRDFLMGWLWPESNLKKARWSLNSAIRALRKLLEDGAPFGSPAAYIVLEEDRYRLCPNVRLRLDVEEFDRRHQGGRCLEKVQGMAEAAAEYEKAIELYRGEYLLEDLYEDWTLVERERLANAYVYMLDKLSDHYLDIGDYQRCIDASYRLLEKDSCYEAAHCRLMRCYTRLGLREMTLRQYRLCQEVLRRRYGADLSPETQTLCRSLVGDDLARSTETWATAG